ncbi:hypothetical protein CPU12_10675 [Malaciobacter molluscorum LMG 25693]|uniref:Uncharacterized protein n=1 Tax=Malaciobacter molluscorum LMG 25693 TaxID=870501 RepID=A0A2G1DFW7_9BACT|nr:hypothetical protein [Malaciobacter molluscorum]AXX91731.1 hypothetical protein AMOL_0734 [Malaciobacter molluscorum LMG 25693]PHO17381.1 hypothetical protein CPU12_10675 [Malaciobacter molluscorum LMG 25693]RXJ92809.1 hypothetical protein CRV00_12360 [Malaciobacter molluscorum]
MAKVSFEVDNKNLTTVLTILKNLKIGLIKNLKVEDKIIEQEDKTQKSFSSNSKYISKEEFKQRIKKQR